jgi:hypothetical protein
MNDDRLAAIEKKYFAIRKTVYNFDIKLISKRNFLWKRSSNQ